MDNHASPTKKRKKRRTRDGTLRRDLNKRFRPSDFFHARIDFTDGRVTGTPGFMLDLPMDTPTTDEKDMRALAESAWSPELGDNSVDYGPALESVRSTLDYLSRQEWVTRRVPMERTITMSSMASSVDLWRPVSLAYIGFVVKNTTPYVTVDRVYRLDIRRRTSCANALSDGVEPGESGLTSVLSKNMVTLGEPTKGDGALLLEWQAEAFAIMAAVVSVEHVIDATTRFEHDVCGISQLDDSTPLDDTELEMQDDLMARMVIRVLSYTVVMGDISRDDESQCPVKDGDTVDIVLRDIHDESTSDGGWMATGGLLDHARRVGKVRIDLGLLGHGYHPPPAVHFDSSAVATRHTRRLVAAIQGALLPSARGSCDWLLRNAHVVKRALEGMGDVYANCFHTHDALHKSFQTTRLMIERFIEDASRVD